MKTQKTKSEIIVERIKREAQEHDDSPDRWDYATKAVKAVELYHNFFESLVSERNRYVTISPISEGFVFARPTQINENPEDLAFEGAKLVSRNNRSFEPYGPLMAFQERRVTESQYIERLAVQQKIQEIAGEVQFKPTGDFYEKRGAYERIAKGLTSHFSRKFISFDEEVVDTDSLMGSYGHYKVIPAKA